MKSMLLVTGALVAGCSDASSPALPDAPSSDASNDAALDASVDPMFRPPGSSGCSDNAGENVCCTVQRPFPTTANTVIDLRDVTTIPRGTCTDYWEGTPAHRGLPLPTDASAYPVKVILPALTGADPACVEHCNDRGGLELTAWGVAIEAGDILVPTPNVLSIYVPPPWKFVSGGFGEAYPYTCLEGYQELGVRTCTHLYYGDFGFATADPNAPSVEVLIELVEAEDVTGFGDRACCMYP